MTEVSDVCSSSACLNDVNRNGSHEDRGRTTCILSIDGGGIRGIIPTSILIFLEEQLQLLDGEHVRLADYFDLMAGASTGGLIAGILSVPNEEGRPKFEAKDVMKIYFEQGPIIFKKSFVPFLKQIRGPKYSATPLEGILQENLKELIMKDTLSEILIPTFDIKLMQPTYFSTREPLHISRHISSRRSAKMEQKGIFISWMEESVLTTRHTWRSSIVCTISESNRSQIAITTTLVRVVRIFLFYHLELGRSLSLMMQTFQEIGV
ncbi:hypothetical protein KP509_34G034700 [Ceratopteris richardii]|uniref:Patatin n=1 Tax=Ceratopteris richardii TaxID=49495 RepID=A0A8T2QK33_CERRI|nr:hypothetical protein KP509_34G034700 [Ceratopteris richardii]